MSWARTMMAAGLMAWLIAGCGGDAGDRLVLQFLQFENPGGQSDVVGQTSAEVDINAELCPDGSVEPFTETLATAVFFNHGGADILLDTITIDIPNGGVGQLVRHPTATIIGGRCLSSLQPCALDAECVSAGRIGSCQHTESSVTFTLFDFGAKLHVSPPGHYEVAIAFSGEDTSGTRFTARTRLATTFDDFNNCPSAGGGH